MFPREHLSTSCRSPVVPLPGVGHCIGTTRGRTSRPNPHLSKGGEYHGNRKGSGVRNPDRPNGKAWKQGKSPKLRAVEAAANRADKAARRAAK